MWNKPQENSKSYKREKGKGVSVFWSKERKEQKNQSAQPRIRLRTTKSNPVELHRQKKKKSERLPVRTGQERRKKPERRGNPKHKRRKEKRPKTQTQGVCEKTKFLGWGREETQKQWRKKKKEASHAIEKRDGKREGQKF